MSIRPVYQDRRSQWWLCPWASAWFLVLMVCSLVRPFGSSRIGDYIFKCTSMWGVSLVLS